MTSLLSRVVSLLLLTLTLVTVAPREGNAQASKVKVLLIGNSKYEHMRPDQQLPRATVDAEGLKALLASLGVPAGNIVSKSNLGFKAMSSALVNHLKRLEPDDVSIVFFSGHGQAVRGRSYLIPTDFNSTTDEFDGAAISLETLLVKYKDGDRRSLGIFIIDACRNEISAPDGGKMVEGSASFAPVRAPEGTFIFYSAGAGEIALEHLGPNDTKPHSVYTRELLPLLQTKKGLHEIAKVVRWTTYQSALKREQKPHLQRPAYFDDILKNVNILGEELPFSLATNVARPVLMSVEIATRIEPGFKTTGFKAIVEHCIYCPDVEVIQIPDGGRTLDLRTPPKPENSGKPGRITLKKRFAIGKYEVTFDEWSACAADGESKSRCRNLAPALGASVNRPGDRRPVHGVSWDDATTYVKWLSEKTGKRYRLPSEAEWEYAARAGSDSPWGPAQDVKSLCEFANGADASLRSLLWANIHCDDGKARGVTTVGSYRANAFGLHDMQGNVWEWVADCYVEPEKAPADGTANQPPGPCAMHVAKGGSWRSGPTSLTIASHRTLPAGERRLTVGFRVALDQD